jgi:EmrB/QacA subfamily drug resistance transporter
MKDVPANQRTALIVVSLSSFIMPLMLSSVNVAIPTIALSFQADAIQISWISTAYLLTAAVFLLPFGRLADMKGRKLIYFYGMATVITASLLAATSQNIEMLILWRVVQGMGAAMLFGTGVAILTAVFPPEKRGRALGINVSAIYFGLTCGPLFGGWVTQHISWRAVFFIHVPIALFILVLTRLKLEGEWKGEEGQKMDLAGALIYALAIIFLMIGLSTITDWRGVVLLIASIICLIVFVRYEKKIEHPLFDVGVFSDNRAFSFSCLASLTLYTCTFALTFLMSLYLQNVKGLSPQLSGVIMICQPVLMALLSPTTGKLSDKIEPRYLTAVGMLLIAVGLTLLAQLKMESTITYILCCLSFTGIGFALFASPNTNAIMSSVDRTRLGVAASSVSTTRVLGQMLSMAVVMLAFTTVMGPLGITPENTPLLLRGIKLSLTVTSWLAILGIYLSMARGNLR